MKDYSAYIAASYGLAVAVMIWMAADTWLRWRKAKSTR